MNPLEIGSALLLLTLLVTFMWAGRKRRLRGSSLATPPKGQQRSLYVVAPDPELPIKLSVDDLILDDEILDDEDDTLPHAVGQ